MRPGTTAERLGDPIPQYIKEKRNQILLNILREQSLVRNKALIGKVEEVLFEGPAKKGVNMFMGRTRGHRKVFVQATPRLIGQLARVKITNVTSSTLTGELLLEGVESVENFVYA